MFILSDCSGVGVVEGEAKSVEGEGVVEGEGAAEGPELVEGVGVEVSFGVEDGVGVIFGVEEIAAGVGEELYKIGSCIAGIGEVFSRPDFLGVVDGLGVVEGSTILAV